MKKVRKAVANRPAEAASGIGLGLAVYGFATQVGLPEVAAGAIAVVVAFGPAAVSRFVDAVRR